MSNRCMKRIVKNFSNSRKKGYKLNEFVCVSVCVSMFMCVNWNYSLNEMFLKETE